MFKIEDIYGIILLLAIGLSGALLVETVEYIFKNTVKKTDSDGTSSMEHHSNHFNQNESVTTAIDVITEL